MTGSLHALTVNTLKGLAMDAIQAANSGHPGMPMGMADVATVLWSRFLKHDPADPFWPDRDRFVLSAGHGSMLLYGLLHLSGYGLGLEDLRQFRQWDSRTPGHPEHGHTVGVETTTGPLGQGLANAVGMAMAERFLRARFGAGLCDHRVWVIASDGDLMEGVAAEAASLAGHLGLDRLVVLYDDNEITIDGAARLSFTEDRLARFAAYGWHTAACNGHDAEAVAAAIEAAVASGRPALVACRTVIGHGSPNKAGSHDAHGAPLGADEVRLTKQALGLDPEAHFVVPDAVVQGFRDAVVPHGSARAAWEARLQASPEREAWEAWHARPLLEAVAWPTWDTGAKVATRKASQAVLQAIVAGVPQLRGGSADLAGSNGTVVKGVGSISAESFHGHTIHFGVREHGMAAACNGMALHGGVVPYCATFLVFHDYMRPSVRLSALMDQQVIYLYSHDSVWVGEDGPTHQPIEQLMSLRLIPGLVTLRPADARETAGAWQVALSRSGPTAILLTRQDLPVLAGSSAEAVAAGAYVVRAEQGSLEAVVIATGSEVSLAVNAVADQPGVRVVSMPSWELFEALPASERAEVLPAGVPRVSVEAGRTLGWERWIGSDGVAVGIDRFGASAPGKLVAERLGMNEDAIRLALRQLTS